MRFRAEIRVPTVASADDALLGLLDRSKVLIVDGRLVIPGLKCAACLGGVHHACSGTVWGDFTDPVPEWTCSCDCQEEPT